MAATVSIGAESSSQGERIAMHAIILPATIPRISSELVTGLRLHCPDQRGPKGIVEIRESVR